MLVTLRYRYPLISSRTDYGAASFMVIPQEVLALLDLWRLSLLRWQQCVGCQSCPSRDARFPARFRAFESRWANWRRNLH